MISTKTMHTYAQKMANSIPDVTFQELLIIISLLETYALHKGMKQRKLEMALEYITLKKSKLLSELTALGWE